MKKLPAFLNTPARLVVAVVLLILLAELLIMMLVEDVITPFITPELWHFIDPILLIAIVSPALYLLIFRPMRAQQAGLERQLDELRRFQRLSIGRELRMKELVGETAALRTPLSAGPAGNMPVTSGSPEAARDAAAQPATTQPAEQDQRSALLFMLEDLEAGRKKIEQAHHEWMAALDVVDDPIFLHDKEFRILRCNKAYQQRAGIPFHEIIGQPYYEIFPKTGVPLPCCLRAMEKAEEEEEEVTSGEAIYRSRSFSIHDEQGAHLYSVHTLEDITERRHQEERTAALLELSESVETLDEKTLLQRGLDTVQRLTDSRIGFLHFVSENQNEIELVTWSKDTLAHYCQAAFDRHYPVSAAGIWADCIRLKQVVVVNDYAAEPGKKGLPEGHAHLQRFISVPVFEGTQVRMIVGVGNAAKDYDEHNVETVKLFSYDLYRIVQRKRAETQLKNSEERHRQIIQTSMDGFWVADTGGRILEVNDAYCQLSGYTREELLNMRIADVEAKEAPEETAQHIREIMTNGHASFETRHRRKDGRLLDIEVSIVHRPDTEDGHLFVFLHDITERKQAEIAIQHANRALATLSAVNKSLVRATGEDELLQSICQAIVKQRGYQLAWVGYKQHDESKSIKIMTRAGHDEGYLDAMRLTWAETERGMEPSGRAIRSGTTQLCQDMANDPSYLLWRDEALKRGYTASIALPLGNGKVFGILSVYAGEANAFTANEIALLEEMARDLAFGVHSLHVRHERDLAQDKVQQQLAQLQDSLEDTMRAIAAIVEMRDPYTAGHQARVADLAAAIAKQMGLPDEQAHVIHLAGTVHDLGKINVPAEILSKPGKLTDLEFGLIKVHPQAGYDILKGIDFPWPIAQMVLQHHERLDGSGYPQGLKGEAILLEARILAVADVVEAISAHRPYRPGLGIDVALEEITKNREIFYDPQAVDACVALFREQGYSFK